MSDAAERGEATYAALERLLDALERRGFRIDPRQRASAHQLQLAQLAIPEFGALKTLLAPVIARSPAEQERFYAEFDKWDTERAGRLPALPAAIDAAISVEPGAGTRRTQRALARRRLIGAVMFLAALSAAAWALWPPHQMQVAQPQAPVTAPPQGLVGQPPRPPKLEVKTFRVTRTETVWWYPYARALVAAFPLLLLGAWIGWRLYLRRFWAGRLPDLDADLLARYSLPVRISGLFETPRFRRAAQELRRHRDEPTRNLDLPRTIDATVKAAGCVTVVHAERPRQPSYLFLLEEEGVDDHQARLFDLALDRFEEEGVDLERRYYQRDPRQLRSPAPLVPEQDLADAVTRQRGRRLVVIGTADGFFHPLTGLPEPWLDDLKRLPSRALLNVRPIERWGHRELQLLEQGYSLATATTAGVQALAGHASAPDAAEAVLLEGIQLRPERRRRRPPPRQRATPEESFATEVATATHSEDRARSVASETLSSADIFIAAARQERHRVELITRKLGEVGLRAWSEAGIDLGAGFKEELYRRVDVSRVILACWTGAGWLYGFLRSAADSGRSRNRLVSCTLDGGPAPEPFNDLETANLSNWEGEEDHPGWREVLKALRERLAGASPEPMHSVEDIAAAREALRRVGIESADDAAIAIVVEAARLAPTDADPHLSASRIFLGILSVGIHGINASCTAVTNLFESDPRRQEAARRIRGLFHLDGVEGAIDRLGYGFSTNLQKILLRAYRESERGQLPGCLTADAIVRELFTYRGGLLRQRLQEFGVDAELVLDEIQQKTGQMMTASSSGEIASKTDEQTIAQICKDMIDQEGRGAAAAPYFQNLLADDLCFRRANGQTVCKRDFINALQTSSQASRRILEDSVGINVLGAVAVASLCVAVSPTAGGARRLFRNIRIFWREHPESEWKLHMWFNAEIPPAS